MDYAYLSVNRVIEIGEKSNFSSQLRAQLHCASPIIYRFVCKQYHVFFRCGYASQQAHDVIMTSDRRRINVDRTSF